MMRIAPASTVLLFLLASCAPVPLTEASAAFTPTIPVPTISPAPTLVPTPIPNTLYVNPSISLGPISPLIYGSNYGPWLSVSLEMLPAAYDSGVTILRFPAGAWGDHNDVQPYQLDQFMDFASKAGAQAMINVRLLGGTPGQAAQLVQYTNIGRGYGVEYWGIGNEPTLYAAELQNRGESYDIDRFNSEWRAFALAMKAVDPAIKLVGPEIHQFSYDHSGRSTNFSETEETWFRKFLEVNGDLVDVVSFHRYPFPRSNSSGPPSIEELRKNSREWDLIISHARNLVREAAGRDLPIAITEFNSSYDKSVGGEATPDSHYNAIWLADVLGRMIQNDVFMANEWALTAKGGFGGLGLVGQSEVYPAYYVYQLYARFGNELLHSSSDDPDLSIHAARRPDGTLTLMIINLSTEEKVKALRIEGHDTARAETWLLDPDHAAESLGAGTIPGEITIPGQSVTLYVLK